MGFWQMPYLLMTLMDPNTVGSSGCPTFGMSLGQMSGIRLLHLFFKIYHGVGMQGFVPLVQWLRSNQECLSISTQCGTYVLALNARAWMSQQFVMAIALVGTAMLPTPSCCLERMTFSIEKRKELQKPPSVILFLFS